MDYEMQAFDKLGFANDCAKLLDFNLRYSSLENLGLAASVLEILAALSGKPCREKQFS